MNTYKINLSGDKLNSYIRGRIHGIIWVLTGMPEMMYANKMHPDGSWDLRFDATEEQYDTVVNAINKTVYAGIIDYHFELC